jgi:hypothetical protein
MSDLLAIFGPADSDAELLAEITTYGPDRVTVLLEDADADWAFDDSSAGESVRYRLAELMAAIEHRTAATVVGFAGDRAQLVGWRFDRELSARLPVAA